MSVEGDRFTPLAVQNLLVLFSHTEFERTRSALGVLKKDIKAAARTAAQKTQRWAGQEAARGIAQEIGLSYRNVQKRIRLRMRYQSMRGGGFPEVRVWFGLNDIPWKYYGVRETKTGVTSKAGKQAGGFVAKGGHAFVRVGKNRLPIRRLEKPIKDNGEAWIKTRFEAQAAEKFIDELFLALDRVKGRTAGASRALVGDLSNATKFAKP